MGIGPIPTFPRGPTLPPALKPGERAPPQHPPRLAAVMGSAQEFRSEPSQPQDKEGLGPRWQIAALVATVFLWACLLPSEAFPGPSAKPPETLRAVHEAYVRGALAFWPVVLTPSNHYLPASVYPGRGSLQGLDALCSGGLEKELTQD